MSDEAKALMNIEEEFAKIAAETSKALTAARGNYISTADKMFSIPGQIPSRTIDCIILDFIRINTKLPAYIPGQRSVPECWAIGYDGNNLIPGSSHKYHDTCKGCPNDEWKSATNKKGKACTNRVRLAVIPPDAPAGSPIWLVSATPTALGDWREYHDLCERQFGASGWMRVVTTLSFNERYAFPSLKFAATKPLTQEQMYAALTMRDAAKYSNSLPPNDD